MSPQDMKARRSRVNIIALATYQDSNSNSYKYSPKCNYPDGPHKHFFNHPNTGINIFLSTGKKFFRHRI